MKNFLLFIYNFEYPGGGFKDYAGSFKTEKLARNAADKAIEKQAKKYNCDIGEIEIGWQIFHIPSRNVITWRKRTPLRSVLTKGIF